MAIQIFHVILVLGISTCASQSDDCKGETCKAGAGTSSPAMLSLNEDALSRNSRMDPGDDDANDPYVAYRAIYDDRVMHDGGGDQESKMLQAIELIKENISQAALTKIDWLKVWTDTLAKVGQTIPGPHAVYVGDASGSFVISRTDDYDVDSPQEVASGSKWHAGIVMLALVDEGILDFDAPVSKYLDFWTTSSADPRSRVKVHHLLQFTSGFGSYTRRFWHTCIGEKHHTFKSCAKKIYDTTWAGFRQGSALEPGDFFFYDHTHMEILGAIAETVTGNTFRELYLAKVAQKINMSIKADNSNGWGYDHPDLGKILHISANDNAKFMTALLSTLQGNGPLLSQATIKQQFQAAGDGLCRSTTGEVVNNGHYCLGWLNDKITYAATHFIGIDKSNHVFQSSPGAYGFWPELLLPSSNEAFPSAVPRGFWWQLAMQLPGAKEQFFTVQFYQLAEAIRGYVFKLMDAYHASWGKVDVIMPNHPCLWPDFCACSNSGTWPKHPEDQRKCDAGLKTSCAASQLHNEICQVAKPTSTKLFHSPHLNRPRLQRSITESCSKQACMWGGDQMIEAGCPKNFKSAVPQQCFSRSSKAAVRCCADSGKWISMTTGTRNYGCHKDQTFVEAALKCSSWGLRLCSANELNNQCGSGCGFDSAAVWTRDSCR